MLTMTATCAMAQADGTTETVTLSSDKHKVETNRFWSNWFITAGGGAQLFVGDHSDVMKFGDRFSPALDFGVGKWFTPGLGVRLMYSGWKIKNVTGTGAHSTGKPYANANDPASVMYEQKFNYSHFHGNVMFNLSNLIYGENEKRVWNLIPYVSAGMIVTKDEPSQSDITFGFGLLNKFRLTKALDLNLDTRIAAMSDHFNGEVIGNKQDGLFSATVGLSYKFKPRSWNRSSVKVVTHTNAKELKRMNDQINEMQAENKRLKDALEAERNKPVQEVVTASSDVAPHLVIFGLGKTTLSKDARASIGFLANSIKKGGKKTYVITGYADNRTGTPAVNERLSRARAQAVYDCLVKEYGIPASFLKIEAKGGVDSMFYGDDALSRAVITEVVSSTK